MTAFLVISNRRSFNPIHTCLAVYATYIVIYCLRSVVVELCIVFMKVVVLGETLVRSGCSQELDVLSRAILAEV